jgi:hypothetical protein
MALTTFTKYVVEIVFSGIALLLITRMVLKLLAANPAVEFINFIYDFSGFFLAPFARAFPVAQTNGSVFEPSVLLAIIVYAVVGIIINTVIDTINHAAQTKTITEHEQ